MFCSIYLVLVLSSLRCWYFLFVFDWLLLLKKQIRVKIVFLTILFWKKKNGSLLNNWINLHWREFSCVCEAYFRVHQIMEVATKVKAIIFQGQDHQFWLLSLSLKYWRNSHTDKRGRKGFIGFISLWWSSGIQSTETECSSAVIWWS